MATAEAFEVALKDVVTAKRLSQTKMDALTAAALKYMKDDTQLVSILYRTHKGLSPSAKVWSLYAFDALARAARHQVNKNQIVADVNAAQGNCATFLLKIQGVLDGLFRDLISSGNAELKEKAKKILDIWTKQNTFSSAVLSPLFAMLQEAENEKEPDKGNQSAIPPPFVPAVPSAPVAPSTALPIGLADVQSTLLALLSQATNAASAPIPTSQSAPPPPLNNATAVPPAPVPVLDANQLALLQQLAQAAQGNAASSQPVPVPASVVPSLTTPNAVPVVSGGPPQPQPLPYRDDHYGPPNALAPRSESEQQMQQQQQHAGGYGPPDRGYPRNDYDDQSQDYAHANEYPTHDPRRGGAPSQRGGYRDRGGPGRGRGRGRWDRNERGGASEHNPYRDRSRDFDAGGGPYDPRGTGRRSSRSRSPPGRFRNGGMGQNRRGARPYSPPRRPSFQDGQREPRYAYGPGPDANMAAGLDEFGREIRPPSPSVAGSDGGGQPGRRHSDSPLPPRSASLTVSERGSAAPENPAADYRGPHYPQSYPDQRPQPYGIPSEPSTSTPVRASASLSPSTSTRPLGAPTSVQGDVGLDAFDRASFDPSQSDSWAALGKAWMVTHGSMPSQEDLMQFVMGGVLPASVSGSSAGAGPSGNGYEGGGPGSSPTRSRDAYDDQAQEWQGQDEDRQWIPNRGYGQRGGWRGGRGGDGGGRGGYGRGRGGGEYGRGGSGEGRGGYGRGRGGYGEGRGDYGGGGGGGRGRGGDYGRGGYDQGSSSNGRGDYGHGPRRGGGRGDFHGRDEYGHGYGRGDYGPGPSPAYGNGNARGAYSADGGSGRGYGPGYNDYQETDAVTLTGSGNGGGASWPDESQQRHQQSSWQAPQNPAMDQSGGGNGGGGSAGKMQKVGDRWVFVRGAA